MLVDFKAGYTYPTFQRKPSPSEMKNYTKCVNEGLSVLDKKVGLIVHNSSVPSLKKNNIGIGSLLSKSAELAFIPFLVANGITSIQQDPDNLRKKADPSPYFPLATAKNIYMIPIERLADSEYGGLVSKQTIDNLINENQKRKTPNLVNYKKVNKHYEEVLTEAYSNFTATTKKNTQLTQLKNEYKEYKTSKAKELEPMALYEILSQKYGNDDWHKWEEEDRNLYISKDKQRINQLIKDNKKTIDYYIFKQWLVERELEHANERNTNLGTKVIGDSPIAYTPVEVWMNQDVFMDGWALGCPPDSFSENGQRWGFPVIKPESIFNNDGTLGKGGILMKEHYEKLFASSSGGARIDHIIGLIDPFVYSTEEPKMNQNNSGRLYSSPDHPILGKYAKHTEDEYAAILEKIVFPAAAKYGLSKEDIICEDLGTLTEPVINIMNHLNLSGIAVTQYDYRAKDIPTKNVIMPGSHDNESLIEYTDNIFNDKKHLEEKTWKLAEDTSVPNENRDNYRQGMQTDKTKFIAASFAELFTGTAKKIQIFFTTFLGMPKTYNRPGETKNCWTLRVPEDYDTLYWKNVKKGTAINLPEVIARAIRNKGVEFASKHQELLAGLDKFTEILKD